MIGKPPRAAAVVPGLLAAALAAAAAAETHDATGRAAGNDRSHFFPVAGNHVVVLMVADYAALELDDPAGPLHGASGRCFGKVELRPPAAEGAGWCLWRDRDGDTALVRWTGTGLSPAGDLTGTWQSARGSGKWVGASGGGDFEAALDRETGERELSVAGEVTLPRT